MTYTCEECKETFTDGWSTDERQEEYEETFPRNQEEEKVILCDECYNGLMDVAREQGLLPTGSPRSPETSR